MMRLFFAVIFAVVGFSTTVYAQSEEKGTRIGVDLYAVHTSLMPYKGYQNDISATFHLKYNDWKLQPFVRGIHTNYYYLNSSIANNVDYTSDTRKSVGAGLDYFLTSYLRVRFIYESIDNRLANQKYNQESLGLIYNQYVDIGAVKLNNYGELFSIPRLSSTSLDSFLRIQALTPFDIYSEANEFSNAIYPFAQYKIRGNDNAVFGIPGSNISLGLGYKFFDKIDDSSTLAFVLEGHSVVYQSINLNGDWAQALAVLQYTFN